MNSNSTNRTLAETEVTYSRTQAQPELMVVESNTMATTHVNVEARLRRALLVVAGGIFLVTPIELWFSEHTEEPLQLVPFVLCALGALAILAVMLAPRRESLLTLRALMVVTIAGSFLGIYEHLEGNFAFELDIRPNATHTNVIMDALKGGNPLLAPGILAVGGVVALIATYYHPKLHKE